MPGRKIEWIREDRCIIQQTRRTQHIDGVGYIVICSLSSPTVKHTSILNWIGGGTGDIGRTRPCRLVISIGAYP